MSSVSDFGKIEAPPRRQDFFQVCMSFCLSGQCDGKGILHGHDQVYPTGTRCQIVEMKPLK